MDDVVAPRRSPGVVALLLVVGIAGVTANLLVEPGTRTQAITAAATSATAALLAAALIRFAGPRHGGWPGAGWIAGTLMIIGIVGVAFAVAASIEQLSYRPSPLDATYLVLLVPLALAIRRELHAHFEAHDRREITIDVWLIAASFSAIVYVLLLPSDASSSAAGSAGIFAILAATQLTAFGALTLWMPTVPHLLQFLAFTAYSVATLQIGWVWSRDMYNGGDVWVNAVYVVAPLLLGALFVMVRHDEGDAEPEERARLARPILTSTGVLTACIALAVIATFDDGGKVTSAQSSVIIVLLGLGVAGRILANQVASTHAHGEVRDALARREIALQEADRALERVREANETLRGSEEHLRLVFDAAVDGFVELDEHDTIVRANDAFGRMVGLDRAVVEGQTWAALAASVDGADAAFARLPDAGQAQIQRTEGQPLFLEARASQVPTMPPRRLVLVRDVTAAKVADQTIRSLFQFLQDRDEDRTRLLRRTNSAIEQERNRIARDLHDGPVQGVSAASLSLEAALLMIKAGDVDRGLGILAKIRLELAQEADALRRLMSGLRPPVLEERGLIPALKETLARFGTEQSITTQFTGTIVRPVPDDLETLAYRVVQEALTNAAKHAHATRVGVHVESDQNQLRVEIEDDGAGFDTGQAREYLRAGRVGLASMRERVELASGTFTILSNPGRGTTVIASLPLDVALVGVTP
jgi:PAS domain S-box-containing protein